MLFQFKCWVLPIVLIMRRPFDNAFLLAVACVDFFTHKNNSCVAFFLTVANCWKKIITRCWNTICEISNLACSKELPYSRGILTVPYICKTAAYITFGATVCLVTCGANHFWLQRKEITIRFLWWSQRIRTLTEASLRRCGVLMRTYENCVTVHGLLPWRV